MRYTFIGTPLQLDLLASMANRILKKKGDFTPVSKHWAARFVKRHLDLKTIKLIFLDQSCKMMHKKSCFGSGLSCSKCYKMKVWRTAIYRTWTRQAF